MADEAAEGVVTEGADLGAGVDGGEPFGAGEVEPTQGETGEAASGEAESEPELFTVKIGGREEKVTFEDLQAGYMRQADYTRKTQEVAEQRNQLAQMAALEQALQRDPRTTLVALAGALGVNLGPDPSATAGAPAAGEADPFEILAREVGSLKDTFTAQQQAALQAQQQAQQAAQVQAQVEREIENLKATHGDFDHMELARYAIEHNIVGPGALGVAYNAWQYEKAEQARIAAENARILAAKRQAQVVSGGRATGATGTVVSGNANGRMSFRDALRAAMAQHADQ